MIVYQQIQQTHNTYDPILNIVDFEYFINRNRYVLDDYVTPDIMNSGEFGHHGYDGMGLSWYHGYDGMGIF